MRGFRLTLTLVVIFDFCWESNADKPVWEANVGEDVRLEFSTGYNDPTVTWKKDKVYITEIKGLHSRYAKNKQAGVVSLTIKNIKKEDAGNYDCEVYGDGPDYEVYSGRLEVRDSANTLNLPLTGLPLGLAALALLVQL